MKALANALQSKGGANILSTPNLMTLDNEAASIMVGQTVPFVSGRYVTDGGGGSNNPFQTIVREDVGLKLRVRPQISEGGTVKLDIYQEVSSIDAQSANSTAGIITNKRARIPACCWTMARSWCWVACWKTASAMAVMRCRGWERSRCWAPCSAATRASAPRPT